MNLNPPPVLQPVDTEGGVLSRPWTQWFSALQQVMNTLLGAQGGKNLNFPYGQFSNSVTQSTPLANTPYTVALNGTDYSNGITRTGSNTIVPQAGLYNIQFSLQFENTSTGIVDTFVWLRKNGTDIPGTASTWATVGSHGGTNGYTLAVCNFYVQCAANDQISLVYAADVAAVINIESYAASTSPFTRPSIPGAVITVSFVSS